jgi:hypothetical protein
MLNILFSSTHKLIRLEITPAGGFNDFGKLKKLIRSMRRWINLYMLRRVSGVRLLNVPPETYL